MLSGDGYQLQQEFKQYLSGELQSFCTIERPALEKIIKIIFSQDVNSQRNFIDYFKCLIKYMRNGIRVRTEDRVSMFSAGGQYVFFPTGIKEQGSNYASNQLLALYFRVASPGSFVIYDFGFRQ